MTDPRTAHIPPEDAAEWLTRVERDRSHPNTRPHDAATLILVDRSTATPTVLLGRRHHGHKFMPGKFVFPGGRVDAHDRNAPVSAPLAAPVAERLMRQVRRPSESGARALAVAAVREMFEETGLMLGRRIASPGQEVELAEPWRQFGAAGLALDLSGLYFIARAITPPRRPRRFDTRFFAADATWIGHRLDDIVGPDTELVELVWLPIAQARELKDMPTITKVVLSELETRINHGIGHHQPAPFYRMRNRRFIRELL